MSALLLTAYRGYAQLGSQFILIQDMLVLDS
jgi:hypothetical protein